MKKRCVISFVLTSLLLSFSHHIWLGHKSKYHFEILLFIIITFLGYLLFFKLISYLAEFKNLKHQSRIDIIFLAVFFILLFIPMSNINQAEKSESENRFLEKWQPLITKEGNLNYNFGKDYEKWFNDRFGQRLNLINLNLIERYTTIQNSIDDKSFLYIKNTNWLFFKNEILTNTHKHFEGKSIEDTADALSRLNDFCNKQNIKLYVMVVPYNTYVYLRETGIYKTSHEKYVKETNDNIELLKNKTNAKIINMHNILVDASCKDEYVYFKTDHHWTEYGAYIGYQTLINEIKKDFPDIHILSEEDYNISRSKLVRSEFDREYFQGCTFKHSARSLEPYQNKILDTEYKYYDLKDSDNLKVEVTDAGLRLGRDYFYPKGNNLRLLEIGSSMNENLLQFTAPTFKKTKYFRLNHENMPTKEHYKIIKYYKGDILNFKPDIMLLCITPWDLNNLKDIFTEDK